MNPKALALLEEMARYTGQGGGNASPEDIVREMGAKARGILAETPEPMTRTAKTVRWTTDDRLVPVTITYSSPMGREELAEFEEFIAIWLRGLRRAVLTENT